MAQDDTQGSEVSGKQARIPEAERREKLTQLVLRRSKLSASEAVLLRALFPEILALHQDRVWNQLRRRSLEADEAEELLQEAFLALYLHILEHGFPDSVPGMLHALTEGKLLNHLRSRKRSPIFVDIPSSGSEKPRSAPDIDRALDLHGLARQLLSSLKPDLLAVIELVTLNGLSHRDVATLLGIPEGTVKSHLIAAKEKFLEQAEKLLPPSQRGPG